MVLAVSHGQGVPQMRQPRSPRGTATVDANAFAKVDVSRRCVPSNDSDVTEMINGRYDAATGRTLLSAAAEATRLAGWASYDAGIHGLAQRYLVQALRLAAVAGDRALGAEILAAMSHQAAYLRSSSEAVDLGSGRGTRGD